MNNITSNYIHLYRELLTNLKWKVTDKRILMATASIYTLNQTPFQMNRFLNLADEIKEKATTFSPLRANSRYTTAAMLDVKFENPESKVEELFQMYDLFREAKFQSGIFTYIAATVLLTNNQEDPRLIIQRTKEIYNGMKKEHSFLTSASDYPLATLLALENRKDVILHIEDFYDELAKNGFRKGNDLQLLSHILGLSKNESKNMLINRAMHVLDAFEQASIKPKQMYYPIIGMLALLSPKEFTMSPIVSVYEELTSQKDFRWQKDMNVMLSTSFFLMDKLDHKGLAETSLNTILEAVLQAQQAAMIAIYSSNGSN